MTDSVVDDDLGNGRPMQANVTSVVSEVQELLNWIAN